FFLVCQLSIICARPHYVGSRLGELCRRDGFAVFHLNGGAIKGDRRRSTPEKPIDTESLSTLRSFSTPSANRRDVDRHLWLIRSRFESWWSLLPDRARRRPLPGCRKAVVLNGSGQC